MLIDGKDQTYFIDRDNCVFQVDNITFLHRKMPNKHIASTLLDGVSQGYKSLLLQVPNLAVFVVHRLVVASTPFFKAYHLYSD